MLLTRILTACVLLVILVGSLWISPMSFELIMAIAMGLTLAEWLLMTRINSFVALGVSAIVTVAMVGVSLCGRTPNGTGLMTLVLAVSCAWCAILAVVFSARSIGFRVKRTTSICMALIFVPTAWLSLVWLMKEGGWQLMLSVFMIVWVADVCAYFFGRAFGHRKMAPAISPGKTWAGAVGALVCVIAVALVAWRMLPHDQIFTSLVLERAGSVGGFAIIFLLVVLSIAGDLFESALKRQAGMKDSSRLLPGHGGFYDRLDACLPVLPAATAILLIL